MRPSREQTNLEICSVIAKRSQCLRGNVGCVITMHHRIVSTGYNNPIGDKVICELDCNLKEGCKHAMHAEANAIAFAASAGVKLFGAILYCSACPCYACAKLIIQAGILKVIYGEDYRDQSGKLLMEENGILIEKFRILLI